MIREEILKKIDDSLESKILNLANLHITDDEIVEIMECAKEKQADFKIINLKNNVLSDAGAIKLKELLMNYDQITQLNLEFNYIGREGIQALSSLRLKHGGLQLYFHGNEVRNVAEMEEVTSIKNQFK